MKGRDFPFKKGIEADLPDASSAVIGVPYLTTDTMRLYLSDGTDWYYVEFTVVV